MFFKLITLHLLVSGLHKHNNTNSVQAVRLLNFVLQAAGTITAGTQTVLTVVIRGFRRLHYINTGTMA